MVDEFAHEVVDALVRDRANRPFQAPEPYLGIKRKQGIEVLNEWTEKSMRYFLPPFRR